VLDKRNKKLLAEVTRQRSTICIRQEIEHAWTKLQGEISTPVRYHMDIFETARGEAAAKVGAPIHYVRLSLSRWYECLEIRTYAALPDVGAPTGIHQFKTSHPTKEQFNRTCTHLVTAAMSLAYAMARNKNIRKRAVCVLRLGNRGVQEYRWDDTIH